MSRTVSTRRSLTAAALLMAGLLLVVTGLFLPTGQSASAQGAEFTFTLYGGNEMPPIASSATGTVTLELGDGEMTYHLQASGAAFTMAHIHNGLAGANGPVVAFLLPVQDPPVTTVDVTGTISEADLLGEFAGNWEAFATFFLADGLYVNIHSTANPSGELRGQADPRFCADLSGANEVPPNDSQGSGQVLLDATTGGAGVSFSASTESDIVGGHIHVGAAGENGPVLAPILDSGMTFGQTVTDTLTILEADLAGGPAEGNVFGFLQHIAVGEAYVNIHSTDEPAGEIRGQLHHCGNTDAAAPPEPTVTPTPTATTTAIPTNTTAPTATTVPPTATATTPPPTATVVPPGPPATGTGLGLDGPGFGMFVLMALGGLMIVAGGATLAAERRH